MVNLNAKYLKTTWLKDAKVCLWFMWDRRTSGVSLPGFPGGHLCIQDRKRTLGFLSLLTVPGIRIRNQSSSRIHLMASLGQDFMSICSKIINKLSDEKSPSLNFKSKSINKCQMPQKVWFLNHAGFYIVKLRSRCWSRSDEGQMQHYESTCKESCCEQVFWLSELWYTPKFL